ncbi:tetratricopeptide repeat protein [Microbispora sp. NPDC049125]|uniref:tetratricopeptide repeat protein n=1 Tax=Microbispora sp. NPDC049125 TaxID=3154929 RepID=UPI0034667EDF
MTAARHDDRISPDEVVQRAGTLLRLGRHEAAERELRGLLSRHPQHSTAHAALALALIAGGAEQEALSEAHEAIRLDPGHYFSHLALGLVLKDTGRPQEALEAARAALSLDHGKVDVWRLLARLHAMLLEWRLAADAARQGLAVAPQDSTLASLLGQALCVLEDGPAALAVTAEAVRLDPESSSAHLVRGIALLVFADAGEAAREFREVLRLDPGVDQARELLVVALKRRNPVHRALSGMASRFRGNPRLLLLLPVAPWLILVIILVALLHWAMWVAETFVTLRMSRGAYTRLLLRRGEPRGALLCLWLLVSGTALLVLGVALGHSPTGSAGVATLALVTPVQEALHAGSRLRHRILGGWATALALVVPVALALSATRPDHPDTTGVLMLTTYAALSSVWVAALVRRLSGGATAPSRAGGAGRAAGAPGRT